MIVAQAITAAKEQPDFGNAGEVENLGRCIADARDLRAFEKHDGAKGGERITIEDIESGVEAWMERRRL